DEYRRLRLERDKGNNHILNHGGHYRTPETAARFAFLDQPRKPIHPRGLAKTTTASDPHKTTATTNSPTHTHHHAPTPTPPTATPRRTRRPTGAPRPRRPPPPPAPPRPRPRPPRRRPPPAPRRRPRRALRRPPPPSRSCRCTTTATRCVAPTCRRPSPL